MTEPDETPHSDPSKPGQKPPAESERGVAAQPAPSHADVPQKPADEVGGPSGPEPTRFGDWERKGRCIDF